MPDRLPSLVLLAGFWLPPAMVGWVAARSVVRHTTPDRRVVYAVLGATVVAYAAAWFLFQLDRIPPYVPGATMDPTYAPPEAVRGLAAVTAALVLPVSAVACVVAFRMRVRRLEAMRGFTREANK